MRIIALASSLFLLALVVGARAHAGSALDDPVRVSFTFQDTGERARGELSAWDDFGFTFAPAGGEAYEVSWRHIDSSSAYNIRRRLIDQEDADAWLRLGVLMLALDDARRAERAFGVAARRDRETAPVADRARSLHAQGKDPALALIDGQDEDAEESEGGAPGPAAGGEGGPARGAERPDDSKAERGSTPWPTLTEEEHAEATRELRERAEGWLREAGLQAHSFETEHYLLYSDLPEPEARRSARRLDDLYDTLCETLEIPRGTRLFRGRCVIFIFQDRRDFIGFEAATFRTDARRAGGLCHMIGENVYVTFFKGNTPQRFDSVLIHETTHAFMYRYKSPAALPTWANEGLADFVAGHLTPHSTEPQDHWQHARNFVMAGGDASEIMEQTYRNGKWFDENSYPVSHMLVRFMLKYKPRAFKDWIDDIKEGRDWERSMAVRFGVTKDVLAQGFADEMRSERGYSRLK